MSIISPADLEASPLADLHALASALGIDGFRRLRKDDLIDAILARQGAAAPARRARASTRRAASAAAPAAEEAEEVEVEVEVEETEESGEAESGERPARSGRSRRRRGGRGREGGEDRGRDGGEEREGREARDARGREEAEPASERIAEGVVELLANGSGFIRSSAKDVSDDDVYISAAQARRCELVSGDRISGPVRAARRSERHPSLIRIDTINGVPAEEAVVGTRIDDIDVDFPSELLELAADASLAALPPFGRGSRVVLAGPPRSGRSALLQRIAAALGGVDGIDVELLAVGVRPEELSEYKEIANATSSGLPFAASGEAQESAVEQAAERGRRIALRGGNAVLLIDTLDGLSPAAQRRTMVAARNLRGAGSLTVIATARAPIGGETTTIGLLPTGEFPSLDDSITGTLRAELLAPAAPAKPARVRKPRAPRKTAAQKAAEEAAAAEETPEPETPDASPELDR
jgi:transcription termination factor Rho